eukprot:GEMP01018322.1.p1 GENE.GEMP01018322.1~~GEMP01018322.1.p1  ORF type:complete len:593 (+),score=126.97 GEMP01018322.1:575-2353(+)
MEHDEKAAVRLEDQIEALDDSSYVDLFKFFDIPMPKPSHPFKAKLLKQRMKMLMERIDIEKLDHPPTQLDEDRVTKAKQAFEVLADETLRKIYTDRRASHWRPQVAFENTQKASSKVHGIEKQQQLAVIKENKLHLAERGGLDKDGRVRGFSQNHAFNFNLFEGVEDSGASDIEWEGRDPHECIGKLLDCIGPMLNNQFLTQGVRLGVVQWLQQDLLGLRKIMRKSRGPAHCIALHGVTLKLPPATQMRIGELAKVLSEAAQMLKTANTFAKFNEAHIQKIARGLELASETYPDLYSNRRLGLLYQFSQVLEGAAPIDSRIQLVNLVHRPEMNGLMGFVLDYDIVKDIYTIRVEKPPGGDTSWIPKKVKCNATNVSKEPGLSKKLRIWARTWAAHLKRPFTNVSDCDRNVQRLLSEDQIQQQLEIREKRTSQCSQELADEALELLGMNDDKNPDTKRQKTEEPSPAPNSASGRTNSPPPHMASSNTPVNEMLFPNAPMPPTADTMTTPYENLGLSATAVPKGGVPLSMAPIPPTANLSGGIGMPSIANPFGGIGMPVVAKAPLMQAVIPMQGGMGCPLPMEPAPMAAPLDFV